MALLELGRIDQAATVLKVAPTGEMTGPAHLAQLCLVSSPWAGTYYSEQETLRLYQSLENNLSTSYILDFCARALFLTGNVHRCLELLSTRERRRDFGSLFWLGAAQWKLGQWGEARRTLADARRLNPYLLKHAERIQGLAAFVVGIDRDLADEGNREADREQLGHELATHLLTVAEIENLVRAYRFDRAASEYAKLLSTLASPVRRAEVETRMAEVRGMAGAHASLAAAVNKGGTGKFRVKAGSLDLLISKASETEFEFTMKGVQGKFPWGSLDTASYCELAAGTAGSPEETFGLGCLAWDAGQHAAAIRLLEGAAKMRPALRKGIDAFVSRKRGIPAPSGGFVPYGETYATPEERANLDKGLVLFQGQWVGPKDRELLSKGMIQVSGKWEPGDEKELLKRGFKKYKGKWMSREDYEALRSHWEEAYTEETEHYSIKTNESESFAKDLAAVIEVAYGEYKKYYGGLEPKSDAKNKMSLYAFRSYEDYRKYCVDNKCEGELNAAGFARSDSRVVVGWNKTEGGHLFLETMVHEAAHLYYFQIAAGARPQSWFAEAMATYFEGFVSDGKTYRFGGASDERLPFARNAMKAGKHITLADLLKGEALALINSDSSKALLFYAECWSLNYYLTVTGNKAYRAAYEEYKKSVAGGKPEPLTRFFADSGQFEKDWVQFVIGL